MESWRVGELGIVSWELGVGYGKEQDHKMWHMILVHRLDEHHKTTTRQPQDKTRQDKTRQDKTRQDKII